LVLQAQELLATELLLQLCPVEAELLKDPAVRAVVKLRLAVLLVVSSIRKEKRESERKARLQLLARICVSLASASRASLGGASFPPQVFFKVFLGGAIAVKYLNGRHVVEPMSQAAQDACRIMGESKYYEQVRR
jgi:hypothetical protein